MSLAPIKGLVLAIRRVHKRTVIVASSILLLLPFSFVLFLSAMLSGGEFDGALSRSRSLGIHYIHIFSIDSFPSIMMTYYTEKARKKQARKQRAAGEQSRG